MFILCRFQNFYFCQDYIRIFKLMKLDDLFLIACNLSELQQVFIDKEFKPMLLFCILKHSVYKINLPNNIDHL